MATETTLTNPDRDLAGLRAAAVDASPQLRGLLSHHVNNPLTVVLVGLEWLLPQMMGERREVVEDALRAAQRIATVVEAVCQPRCAACGATATEIAATGHRRLGRIGHEVACPEACTCRPEHFSLADHERA
jgi:hypothetical protein